MQGRSDRGVQGVNTPPAFEIFAFFDQQNMGGDVTLPVLLISQRVHPPALETSLRPCRAVIFPLRFLVSGKCCCVDKTCYYLVSGSQSNRKFGNPTIEVLNGVALCHFKFLRMSVEYMRVVSLCSCRTHKDLPKFY